MIIGNDIVAKTINPAFSKGSLVLGSKRRKSFMKCLKTWKRLISVLLLGLVVAGCASAKGSRAASSKISNESERNRAGGVKGKGHVAHKTEQRL